MTDLVDDQTDCSTEVGSLSPARSWLLALGPSALRALGLIYSAYLATRLLLVWRLPVFWDEGFYAVQAQTAVEDRSQRFQFLADGKPPLFNWASSFLVHVGLAPVTAVRTVSLLAGLATLTVVMVLLRRLIGPGAALWGGALYVLVPFFLVYDSYGVIDGLFAATMATSLYFQVRLATRPTLATAMTSGVAMGAAMLTRPLGLLCLVLLPLSLMIFNWGHDRRRRRLLQWAGLAALATSVAYTLTLVLRLTPLYSNYTAPQAEGGQYRPLGRALGSPFKYLPDNWSGIHHALSGYFGWPLLALAVTGVVVAIARRDRFVLLTVPWVVGPVAAAMLLVDFGFPRYILGAMPGLLILATYGTSWVVDQARARLTGDVLGAAGAVGVAIVIIWPLILDSRILVDPERAAYPSEDGFQYSGGWPSGSGLEQIKAAIEREAPAGTSVVWGVYYTPWNLAALFDDPVRIPGVASPVFDGVRVRASGGRTIEFSIAGRGDSSDPEFILQHDVFGTPSSIDLRKYHLVASYTRRAGTTFQGHIQPAATVQLYMRNGLTPAAATSTTSGR